MDERLEKALNFANYMQTVNTQKKNIYKRYETLLLLTYEDGLFTANQSLIGYVQALLSSENDYDLVMDNNQKAIVIHDLKNFLDSLLSANYMALNYLNLEYKKLDESRNIKKVLDL